MDEKEQETLDDILQAYGLDGDGVFLETQVATALAEESLAIDQPQSKHESHRHIGGEKTLGSGVELEQTGWSRSQRPTLSTQLLPDTEGPDHGLHQLQPPPNTDPSDTEIDDEMTNQLSCRLGKLQFTQDGQLRYFGSTSNLHLLDVLVSVTLPAPNIVEREAQEVLETARLNADIDESFEEHLIELYFTWQDPSLHLVDYDKFWKARAQHNYDGMVSPYYSRILVDAMLVERGLRHHFTYFSIGVRSAQLMSPSITLSWLPFRGLCRNSSETVQSFSLSVKLRIPLWRQFKRWSF